MALSSSVGTKPVNAPLVVRCTPDAASAPGKHRPFALDGGLCCRLCLHKASTRESIANFLYRTCPGSVLRRIGTQDVSSEAPNTQAVARSHCLSVVGGIVWCRTCGLYAEKRIRKLIDPCTGSPGLITSTERARRRIIDKLTNGLHPVLGHRVQPLVWPADVSVS